MENKWQQMLSIVDQYPELHVNPTKQFRKLYISRLLTENLFACLLQYMGLMISTLNSFTSPLWLATGTASAFIFLRGLSILPGIGLGSLIAYYLYHPNLEWAFICAMIYTIQAYLLLKLTHRFIGGSPPFFNQPFQVVQFVILSGILTLIASYFLVMFSSHSFHLWILVWFANFNSALILTCSLIAWDMFFPQINRLKKRNTFQHIFSYAFLSLLIILLLLNSDVVTISVLSFFIIVYIIFLNKLYGTYGAIFAIFLLGLSLTIGSFLNVPLFNTTHFLILFLIQILLFLVTTIVILMPYHNIPEGRSLNYLVQTLNSKYK